MWNSRFVMRVIWSLLMKLTPSKLEPTFPDGASEERRRYTIVKIVWVLTYWWEYCLCMNCFVTQHLKHKTYYNKWLHTQTLSDLELSFWHITDTDRLITQQQHCTQWLNSAESFKKFKSVYKRMRLLQRNIEFRLQSPI